jgi:hypothetical protein
MTRDYLFEYEPRSGRLEITPFDDSEAALDAYADAEREHLGDWVTEIVLLGADSIDTLRVTHSHYFASGRPPIIHELNRPYAQAAVPAKA